MRYINPSVVGYLSHRLYLWGYRGCVLPRLARRLIAGSSLHRGWLAGHMGVYEEGGVRYGVLDRGYYCYRCKGQQAT